jgi:ubiquinone/menaquinone biosynthesis C-methylase UbiE
MTRGRIALPVFVFASLVTVHAQQAPHTRLFLPENLGELEGPDRESWQRPDRIMDALAIGEGSYTADLGAGGGWFTVRLARRVGPNGKVYAEDIQWQMVDAMRRRADREGFKNVETILGTAVDSRLPDRKIDAILIVDAYHEFEQPTTLLRNAAKALKPAGVIGIVDFKKDGGGPGPLMDERVEPEKVIADARAAGLELRKRETFLRYQFMLIFGLPAAPR